MRVAAKPRERNDGLAPSLRCSWLPIHWKHLHLHPRLRPHLRPCPHLRPRLHLRRCLRRRQAQDCHRNLPGLRLIGANSTSQNLQPSPPPVAPLEVQEVAEDPAQEGQPIKFHG